MTTFAWEELLQTVSRVWIEDARNFERKVIAAGGNPPANTFPPDMVEACWLGYPSVTEEQVVATEVRLGVMLPTSYREFLKVSNGWGMWDEEYPGFHLLPLEQINWFVNSPDYFLNPGEDIAEIFGEDVPDELYFVYNQDSLMGPTQDCIHTRFSYLPKTLQISKVVEEAVVVLNPEVSLIENEWEGWYIDPKLPGINRYKTFWNLMQCECGVFAESNNSSGAGN